MSQAEVTKIVKKYAAKLKKENFPFSGVYLFGSYAENKSNKNSDIDVAVVSDAMKKNRNKNEDKLWKYAVDVDCKIEPIGMTIEEFDSTANPISIAIKSTGIKII